MGERTFRVRFNADTHRDLPWGFFPEQREVVLKAGEAGLAFYRAENRSQQAVTGTATFNVTPFKAGPYFAKTQCFCFTEQRLIPGEGVCMGVSFYVDPAILEDPNLAEVTTITLSYTFFQTPEQEDDETSASTAALDQAAAEALEQVN